MASENFSFSVNWPTNRTGGADNSRYLSVPFEARAIQGGDVLLLKAGASTPIRLPMQFAQVLSFCDRLRTLGEHARHAASMMNMPSQQSGALRQPLEKLVGQGLLLRESEQARRLRAGQQDSGADPIEILFIRTCARPDTLERLLQSLARQPAGSGLRQCVIVDDAPDASDASQTRRLAEAAAPRLDCTVHVVDREDRRRFIERLAADSGADPAALTWCIEGDAGDGNLTYGAGPNLALLLAAGSRFALMDDDASFDGCTPAKSAEEAVFAPETRNRITLPGLDEALPGGHYGPLPDHPLASHSRFLGRTAGGLMSLAGDGEPTALDELTPALLHDLARQPRVKFTCSGVAGDPGTDDVQWLFASRPDDLRPIADDTPESGRKRLLQRRVVRCPRRAVATPAFALMTTTLTGVDNRELLLPTAARGRNEDMLYGGLTTYLYPDSLQLTLPHALYHLRPRPRTWADADLDTPRFPNRGRFLFAWLEDLGQIVASRDIDTRVEFLAAGLRDLARQDIDGLKTALARHMVEIRSSLIERVERTRKELAPPDWLAADFTRVIDACAMTSDDTENALDAVARSTQQFAGRYSECLQDWCRAWRHCRDRDLESLLEK